MRSTQTVRTQLTASLFLRQMAILMDPILLDWPCLLSYTHQLLYLVKAHSTYYHAYSTMILLPSYLHYNLTTIITVNLPNQVCYLVQKGEILSQIKVQIILEKLK
jgi:hypothetical protein